MTPDGARYLAAVSRQVPYPFHFRWLLPFVLRKNIQAWEYVLAESMKVPAALVLTEMGGKTARRE